MGGMCGNTKYNDYAFVDMAKLAIKAGHALYLPRNEYPEVTFENSPMEVELIIKK